MYRKITVKGKVYFLNADDPDAKASLRRSLHVKEALGLKDPNHFQEQYLQPAIRAGLTEMTLSGKPNSRFQKYCLNRLNY